MRSFSVLPCVLLLAFILHTTLCGEQNQSNQAEGSEESCEEGDEDCEEVSCEEGDERCTELESCEEGEEGCEEVSCEEGDKDCDSDEEKGSNKKDDSNESCEISCYCHDDKQSVCAVEAPKPPPAQHPKPKQDSPKPRSEPHTGAGVAAGVAAGAAAAAAAGAAAQHKPPPAANKPKPQQSKPKQEQKPLKQDGSTCNWCIRPTCNPGACTAKPDFDAKADAEALHKAMKGAGTKEKVLTDILTHRSEEQIEEIRQAYQSTGSGLDEDVRGDTSLKVKKIFTALLQTRAEFFAEELHEAFDDDNESAMIMILTSLSPCAIKQVGSAYSKKYNFKPLAKAAEDASAFKFEDFLVELIKGEREKDGPPNSQKAIEDAKALIKAGPDSWFFKGKDTFIDIFTHRSYSQLREIKKQYEILKPKPGFMKDIEEHSGGGKLTKGLLVMMKTVENQPGYFADEIEGSLNKLINPFGIKDNDKLVRVLRGRCGIDLGDIEAAYPKNHNQNQLVNKLKEKSMGDYEDVLVAMMGGKK